ncbi:Hypothetical_protein [Hexamita inflata]|uniref:Hypothetical_protein n=1 Tax=Hexamita inflata TaxID=28002 RepID=A0AA86PXF5_9EUKA|nr:Hypothetical protein HINF_LOCUS30715 [Hexamita inflata]
MFKQCCVAQVNSPTFAQSGIIDAKQINTDIVATSGRGMRYSTFNFGENVLQALGIFKDPYPEVDGYMIGDSKIEEFSTMECIDGQYFDKENIYQDEELQIPSSVYPVPLLERFIVKISFEENYIIFKIKVNNETVFVPVDLKIPSTSLMFPNNNDVIFRLFEKAICKLSQTNLRKHSNISNIGEAFVNEQNISIIFYKNCSKLSFISQASQNLTIISTQPLMKVVRFAGLKYDFDKDFIDDLLTIENETTYFAQLEVITSLLEVQTKLSSQLNMLFVSSKQSISAIRPSLIKQQNGIELFDYSTTTDYLEMLKISGFAVEPKNDLNIDLLCKIFANFYATKLELDLIKQLQEQIRAAEFKYISQVQMSPRRMALSPRDMAKIERVLYENLYPENLLFAQLVKNGEVHVLDLETQSITNEVSTQFLERLLTYNLLLVTPQTEQVHLFNKSLLVHDFIKFHSYQIDGNQINDIFLFAYGAQLLSEKEIQSNGFRILFLDGAGTLKCKEQNIDMVLEDPAVVIVFGNGLIQVECNGDVIIVE